MSRSTAASTTCDVQVNAADPTTLVATVRRRPFEKKTKSLLNKTEEKNMVVSAPTATLSETINHTSIPHQNKLKDQRYTTVPTPHSFHSQSSRCCFPITQIRKPLEKTINQRVYVHNMFLESLAVPYQQVTASAWTRR